MDNLICCSIGFFDFQDLIFTSACLLYYSLMLPNHSLNKSFTFFLCEELSCKTIVEYLLWPSEIISLGRWTFVISPAHILILFVTWRSSDQWLLFHVYLKKLNKLYIYFICSLWCSSGYFATMTSELSLVSKIKLN